MSTSSLKGGWPLGLSKQEVELRLAYRRHTVAELTKQGWVAGEIAELLGVNQRTVTRDRSAVAREAGVRPVAPPRPECLTCVEIEHFIGFGLTLHQVARRAGLMDRNEMLVHLAWHGRPDLIKRAKRSEIA